MKKALILATCICFNNVSNANAEETLKICTDNNFWYPFTYEEQGKAVGLHIDIVSKALTKMGIKAEYHPLPWKRCLKEAEDGKYDGIATASYKEKRAEFLLYPDDAASKKKSDHRVMQVEYVVVTPSDSNYEYDGDVKNIPAPVRVPRGYSMADDLRKQGVDVDDSASGDENNIKKLLRAAKGSVVTLPKIIEVLGSQPAYQGKLKISNTPVKSKSYYLAFTKKGSVDKERAKVIWENVAKVRDDQAFMTEASAKY